MDRRQFVKTTATASMAAAAGMLRSPHVAQAGAARAADKAERPNVLYIIVHDLGTALACYGEPVVKTPNLDRFASEGVRMGNYFCTSTPCSPSRGCIVTGRYAHTNGLIGLANENWSLPMTERTIVDHMNDGGYYTVNFGGQHERNRLMAEAYRYREQGAPQRRQADQVADDVCEFLKKWDAKKGPFYVNAYSQDVHAPWDRPEFQGKYDPDEIRLPAFLPNLASLRKSMSQFYGSISFMDAAMGRIFDTLNETGLVQNTLVIFNTDHGVGFPRAKGTLYDPGLTTSLLIRWPGHIGPGTVCEHMINNIDLVPTELELLGLPIPQEVQGKSFAPAILGGDYTPHEHTFYERNYHDDYDPMRAVRTTRYKLIRNYSERPRFKLPSEATEEDTPTTLRDSGEPRPFEELYDLEKDPHEFNNVIDDPAYAEAAKSLREKLDQWMRDTGDYMRGATQFVDFPSIDKRVLPLEKLTAGPAANRRKSAAAARKKPAR